MGSLQKETRALARAGKLDQAVLRYEAHLKDRPQDLDARADLRALVRRYRGKIPRSARVHVAQEARGLTIYEALPLDALPRCEALLRRDPNSVPALIRLGQAALRGGLKQVGVWAFKDALRLSPGDPEILIALNPFCTAPRDCFTLGRALYERGLYVEAVDPLERAAATIPFAAKAGVLLGQCLLKLGRTEDAIHALRFARRSECTGSTLWNDITYLLGRIPDQAGDPEQATEHYRELAKAGSERSLFALAEETGALHVVTDLHPGMCDPRAVEAVPGPFAQTYRVCPIAFDGDVLVVALADPVGASTILDDLRFILDREVVGAVADPDQVDFTIRRLYPSNPIQPELAVGVEPVVEPELELELELEPEPEPEPELELEPEPEPEPETVLLIDDAVGRSAEVRDLLRIVDLIQDSDSPVLIQGEPGFTKELVARNLHSKGPRRHTPFFAIPCSALTEAALRAKLFGAGDSEPGLVARSDATLFLDDIQTLSLPLQGELLRALAGDQRCGGPTEQRGPRLISGASRDLTRQLEAGGFRQDLYYRLNLVTLELPRDDPRPLQPALTALPAHPALAALPRVFVPYPERPGPLPDSRPRRWFTREGVAAVISAAATFLIAVTLILRLGLLS